MMGFELLLTVRKAKALLSPRMRRPMVARGDARLCERNPWKMIVLTNS